MPKGIHNGNRAPKRSKAAKELDRAKMVHMLRRGYTQVQVAAELGLHPTQIHYDWKAVLKKARDGHSCDAEELLVSKLEEYSEVKKEAWKAWDRSKENSKKVVEELVLPYKGKDGEEAEASVEGILRKVKEILTTEGRLPANEYLNTVLKCLAGERELLGIDAAKELNVSAKVGIAQMDFDAIADQNTPVPDVIAEEISRELGYKCGNSSDPAPVVVNGLKELGNSQS